MKKILFVLMAACCIWAAWDYSRPVDKYVVKMVFRSNFNPIITRMIGERQCLHQKK